MSVSEPILDNPAPRRPSRLIGIFCFAVAIRWTYVLVVYSLFGKDGILLADSYAYLTDAQTMAADILAGRSLGWQWLGADVSTMPLFTWLVTLNVIFAGPLAALTTVLLQGLIDAGTCLVVYRIAWDIAPSFALPAAIAACINPTQIILSGILYTDTLFVFLAAASVLASLCWLRSPSLRQALIVGLALGAAALTRVLIAVWTPILIVFLLATLGLSRTLRLDHFRQMLVTGGLVALCLTPIVVRNVTQYGAWALTPQGGGHLALWVAPLVKQAHDGTPWEAGAKAMEAEMQKRYPEASPNRFEQSRRYGEVGREALAQLGIGAIAKAWITGAVINLASPAVTLAPPVTKLPRTGFYDTQGSSITDKVFNFLFRSDNALYAWIVLLGISGLAIMRIIQLVGLFAALRIRSAIAPMMLLGLWGGYILAINGPVASPKYRFPIEPVLAVLTGAGYCTFRKRLARGEKTRPA
jgi:hypothetical protein